MKKILIVKITNVSVILFLIFTCIFVLIHNTKDRYKVHEYDYEKDTSEKVSKKDGEFNVEIRETPKKDVTYSCPDGYKLDGVSCISKMDPTTSCGENMEPYASGSIAGCIKPATGVSTVKGSCLEGQAIKNDQCYEVYNYTYTCPDGYNLKSKTCTKIIDAIQS